MRCERREEGEKEKKKREKRSRTRRTKKGYEEGVVMMSAAISVLWRTTSVVEV